ncbi:hypothetical protein BGZ49_002433 [Haplosporangium sp. Z 27]|nr:hypothetical protein BGZ49_002433 [Haplosporangium sp. Z 27]
MHHLSVLVRVCRLWKESFTPFIWHSLSFITPANITTRENHPEFYSYKSQSASSYKAPSPEAIMKNDTMIKSVTLTWSASQHSKDTEAQMMAVEFCSHLKQLVADTAVLRQEALWKDISKLLARNPQIEIIILSNLVPSPPGEFFNALEKLHYLKKFKSLRGKYSSRDIARLLAAHAENLEVLEFVYDLIQDHGPWGRIDFSNLRSLTLEDIGGIDVECQLGLIQHATNLKSIHWDLGKHSFPAAMFYQRVLPNCLSIEEFKILADEQAMELGSSEPTSPTLNIYRERNATPLDETHAQILGLTKVTRLESPLSGFGPLGMTALRKHSSWITRLNFQECSHFTSLMAQECLSTMPLLTKFVADKISQLDIIKGYESGSHWICKKLRVLGITIVDFPPLLHGQGRDGEDEEKEEERKLEIHAKVFEQLSALKELFILLLGYHHLSRREMTADRDPSMREGLLFTQKAGLSKLGTLKELKILNVYRVRQGMSIEDAMWIQEHWKNIRWIQGNLNPSELVEQQIIDFFQSHKINVSWNQL